MKWSWYMKVNESVRTQNLEHYTSPKIKQWLATAKVMVETV